MTTEQRRQERRYNREAKKRLALLDRLYPQCKWELFPMQIDTSAEQDNAERGMGL